MLATRKTFPFFNQLDINSLIRDKVKKLSQPTCAHRSDHL